MSGNIIGFGWEIIKLAFWKLSILDLICCPGINQKYYHKKHGKKSDLAWHCFSIRHLCRRLDILCLKINLFYRKCLCCSQVGVSTRVHRASGRLHPRRQGARVLHQKDKEQEGQIGHINYGVKQKKINRDKQARFFVVCWLSTELCSLRVYILVISH